MAPTPEGAAEAEAADGFLFLVAECWMTGGREGSNILQKNEVLQYPALYTNTGTSPGFELKRWQWSNEKAKHTEVVDNINGSLFKSFYSDMEFRSEVHYVSAPDPSGWSLRSRYQ